MNTKTNKDKTLNFAIFALLVIGISLSIIMLLPLQWRSHFMAVVTPPPPTTTTFQPNSFNDYERKNYSTKELNEIKSLVNSWKPYIVKKIKEKGGRFIYPIKANLPDAIPSFYNKYKADLNNPSCNNYYNCFVESVKKVLKNSRGNEYAIQLLDKDLSEKINREPLFSLESIKAIFLKKREECIKVGEKLVWVDIGPGNTPRMVMDFADIVINIDGYDICTDFLPWLYSILDKEYPQYKIKDRIVIINNSNSDSCLPPGIANIVSATHLHILSRDNKEYNEKEKIRVYRSFSDALKKEGFLIIAEPRFVSEIKNCDDVENYAINLIGKNCPELNCIGELNTGMDTHSTFCLIYKKLYDRNFK